MDDNRKWYSNWSKRSSFKYFNNLDLHVKIICPNQDKFFIESEYWINANFALCQKKNPLNYFHIWEKYFIDDCGLLHLLRYKQKILTINLNWSYLFSQILWFFVKGVNWISVKINPSLTSVVYIFSILVFLPRVA